jgi:hypothetical protein
MSSHPLQRCALGARRDVDHSGLYGAGQRSQSLGTCRWLPAPGHPSAVPCVGCSAPISPVSQQRIGHKFRVRPLRFEWHRVAGKNIEEIAAGIVGGGTTAACSLPGRFQRVISPRCPTRVQPHGSRMSDHCACAVKRSPGWLPLGWERARDILPAMTCFGSTCSLKERAAFSRIVRSSAVIMGIAARSPRSSTYGLLRG